MQTVEVAWQVGPIPVDDHVGKEVILRLQKHDQHDYNDDDGKDTQNTQPCMHSKYTQIQKPGGEWRQI